MAGLLRAPNLQVDLQITVVLLYGNEKSPYSYDFKPLVSLRCPSCWLLGYFHYWFIGVGGIIVDGIEFVSKFCAASCSVMGACVPRGIQIRGNQS